jgi:site-specific DNA-methyltransferase (cytosine-N4-specific)
LAQRIAEAVMLQITSTNTSINQLLNTVICGDAYDLLGLIPADSVDLIITSPPYWGHRDYDLKHNWKQLNDIGRVKKVGSRSPGYHWYRSQGGVLGLEPYPEWYIAHLTEIFQRAHYCLKPQGSLWINLGDTYFARWSSIRNNGRQGFADQHRKRRKTPMGSFRAEKQLLLVPARFAIAMQECKWVLRNDLIWHKPNALPLRESDRLNLSHEHFFHFVKKPKYGRPKYYYDATALETRQTDVVSVFVEPGADGHTATFPKRLVKPRIMSCCPPGGVVLDPFCGTGRALEVAIESGRSAFGFDLQPKFADAAIQRLRK